MEADVFTIPPKGSNSPNKEIEGALKKLLKKIDGYEPDVAVKVLNSAIAWEKVKNAIREKDDNFDPDNL